MRHYYHNTITKILSQSFDAIWAQLTAVGRGDLLHTQKQAWAEQIKILKAHLSGFSGDIFFEYSIPRMGKRIDAVLLIDGIVFVVEFKVGSKELTGADINQVWDYALDLKYFHEESHHLPIIPILVATNAKENDILLFQYDDQIVRPILSNGDNIADIIRQSQLIFPFTQIDNYLWSISRYAPTPTIIEAAQALYKNHSVKDISRSDADNLTDTSNYIFRVIEQAKTEQNKVICFVTGVPGAGKTLVGLNISTQSAGKEGGECCLSFGQWPIGEDFG